MTTTFKQEASFSDLVSHELTQIRLNQFIVHFIFIEGSEITVESSFEHIGENGQTLSQFEVYGKKKEVTIHKLLGEKVYSIEVESDDCLKITFNHGGSIRIFRDPRRLESCTIYLDKGFYIIS